MSSVHSLRKIQVDRSSDSKPTIVHPEEEARFIGPAGNIEASRDLPHRYKLTDRIERRPVGRLSKRRNFDSPTGAGRARLAPLEATEAGIVAKVKAAGAGRLRNGRAQPQDCPRMRPGREAGEKPTRQKEADTSEPDGQNTAASAKVDTPPTDREARQAERGGQAMARMRQWRRGRRPGAEQAANP